MIKKTSLYLAIIFIGSSSLLKGDTPYEILNVAEDATLEQIAQAHKDLARQWHPDKHPNNAARAHEMMREINNAFDKIKEERAFLKNFNETLTKQCLCSKAVENGIQTFLQIRSFESSAIKEEVDFILSHWNLIKQEIENNDNLVRFFNDGINQTRFKTIITHSIGLNLAQLLTIVPFVRYMVTPRTYFIDDQLRLAIITNIKWPEIITEMIFDSLGIATCDKLLNRRATILANVIIENKNRIEALYKEYLEAEKNSDELALDCIRSDMTQILTPSHKSLYVEIKELVTSLKVGNKIQALIAKAFLTSAGIYAAKNVRTLGNFVEIFLNNLHATQKPGLLSAP